MLRLRKTHYPKVPDSLAILAALVLITSSLVGMNSADHFSGTNQQAASQSEHAAPVEHAAPAKDVSSKSGKRSGFRMSFFLFRRY